MKYLFDLTQNQSEKIKELIKDEKYQSVNQFISTAIENQIYIENDVDSNKNLSNDISYDFEIKNNKENNKVLLKNITIFPNIIENPSFSMILGVENENQWLWGQINRIFPIKLGLRVLLMCLKEETWIVLDDFTKIAIEIASEYGDLIREYEEKNNKLRSNKVSIGLPKKKSFKSQNRYKYHFLAYVRSKDNKFDGAMSFLKFVSLKKNDRGTSFIGLTKEGLEFAKLGSSIIDKRNFEESLTIKEINFYLDHVSKNVPAEKNAICWILNKLARNDRNREELNNDLKNDFSNIWKGVSMALINTQRSGLMGRMSELGLINTDKEGINVKYKITNKGLEFLDKK